MHLAGHFRRRGYLVDLILRAALKARQLNRDQLLQPLVADKKSDDEKVFIITTFHPSDQSARDIARSNWDILGQSPTADNLYRKKLTIGYRRPKNLRDLLVRAHMPRIQGDEAVDPHTPVVTEPI